MKKIILLGLVSIMSISLCGCANSEVEQLKKENARLKAQIVELQGEKEIEQPQKTNIDIVLVEQSVSRPKSEKLDYIETSFTVKNNTDKDIKTVTLVIKELDESGNIIDTTSPQDSVTVSPQQNLTITALSKKDVYAVQLDSYSYYEGENYNKGTFSNTEKLVIQ